MTLTQKAAQGVVHHHVASRTPRRSRERRKWLKRLKGSRSHDHRHAGAQPPDRLNEGARTRPVRLGKVEGSGMHSIVHPRPPLDQCAWMNFPLVPPSVVLIATYRRDLGCSSHKGDIEPLAPRFICVFEEVGPPPVEVGIRPHDLRRQVPMMRR